MKIMKLISTVIIIFGLVGTVNASALWQSNFGTHSNLSNEDDENELFNLGFDFTFYGNVYNEVYGTSNGSLFFIDEEDYEIGSDIESEYGPMIAAFNADLDPEGQSGDIYTNTLGSAGDMRFVMTWLDVGDLDGAYNNSFQAILYQNGSVELNYLQLQGSADNQGLDVIGVSSGDGINFNYLTAADGNINGIYPDGKSLLYTLDATGNNYDLTVRDLAVDTIDVPEPTSLAIFSLGMFGLVFGRLKKSST